MHSSYLTHFAFNGAWTIFQSEVKTNRGTSTLNCVPWIIKSVVKYKDLTTGSEFLPLNLDVIDFPVSWLSYSFSKVSNISASFLFREQYRAPHLVVFHLIALCKYCVFTNGRFLAVLHQVSQYIGTIFSNGICSLCVSASHFGGSHIISNFLNCKYICYGNLWSVIFDVPIIIVMGCPDPYSYKMMNLID